MSRKREKSSKIVEKLLEEGSLTCHTIIEEIRDKTTLVTYPIQNFTELTEGKEYIIEADLYDGQWHFSLLKSKNMFQIISYMKHFNRNALIGLHRSDGRIESAIYDNTIIDYNKTFCFVNKDILDPQKKLLNNGDLVAECMYTALPQESNILFRTGLQMNPQDLMQNSDVDLLCNDLRDLYLSSQYYDFEIVMGYTVFKVHKFIICARSKYFERVLRLTPDNNRLDVEFVIDPTVMHEIFLYIYSGQLRDMDTIMMCDALEVSCYMEMPCAIQICIYFFKSNLSFDVLEYLVTIIKDFNLRELGNDVINFLNKQPKEILSNVSFIHNVENALELLDCMGFRCHPSVYNAVRYM